MSSLFLWQWLSIKITVIYFFVIVKRKCGLFKCSQIKVQDTFHIVLVDLVDITNLSKVVKENGGQEKALYMTKTFAIVTSNSPICLLVIQHMSTAFVDNYFEKYLGSILSSTHFSILLLLLIMGTVSSIDVLGQWYFVYLQAKNIMERKTSWRCLQQKQKKSPQMCKLVLESRKWELSYSDPVVY
jgi:hypothetical protein